MSLLTSAATILGLGDAVFEGAFAEGEATVGAGVAVFGELEAGLDDFFAEVVVENALEHFELSGGEVLLDGHEEGFFGGRPGVHRH